MTFRIICLTGTAVCLLWLLQATAQTAPADGPAGLWERANLLGDMDGLRTSLSSYGISIGLTETSEVLGNLTGGVRRGADYDGVTTMSLGLDTGKALHWSGGTFYISALQIHGRGINADNLDNLQTASNIEGDRATRLYDLWFQQAFPGGRADLKIGQQDVSEEFIVSRCCSLFLNSAMGWPALPAADLYAGGPVYPLSSPGVRLRLQPSRSLTFLGGVFDDNPPGGPFNDDSQLRGAEAAGVRFNLNTGALIIAELQYDLSPVCNNGSNTGSLPGTYKLGAWYDTASFPDQRSDTTGLSLANPAGSGVARMHRGNFSIYGIADQMVWQKSGGPRSVSAFARIYGAPSDRNLVDWSLNAGVDLNAPLRGRKGDTFGIGYGWAHVSGRAAEIDRDTGFFTSAAYPVRTAEHFIELTYRYQVAPWCTVQPDLQYIINPGGGLPNPRNPSRRIGNELVFGLRTIVTF